MSNENTDPREEPEHEGGTKENLEAFTGPHTQFSCSAGREIERFIQYYLSIYFCA